MLFIFLGYKYYFVAFMISSGLAAWVHCAPFHPLISLLILLPPASPAAVTQRRPRAQGRAAQRQSLYCRASSSMLSRVAIPTLRSHSLSLSPHMSCDCCIDSWCALGYHEV